MHGRKAPFRWRPAGATAALGLILAATLAVAVPGDAGAAELAPFEASFNVNWRGMGAGTATLTLRKHEQGHWIYESRNVARGVFKVAIPGTIRQSSELSIQDGRVAPQLFRTDDGSEKSKRDTEVRFDWQAGRATGTAEGKPVDVALQPGLQDSLSVQIALIHELLAGRTPASFLMLDKTEIKEYLYSAEGNERVETALGPHETIKYRSKRPNSDRSTVFWCAPALGYLPVKVERQRGDKIEWSMGIAKLTRE
jgi:hypothetical protein